MQPGPGISSRARLVFSVAIIFLNSALHAADLRVGAGTAEFVADDSMPIAGGIGPGKASGQEGKLRAVAVVLEQNTVKLAVVACDILMMTRQFLDPVVEQIEQSTGISKSNVFIHCTHTHHAPSTVLLHGYRPNEQFSVGVQEAILKSVQIANTDLTGQTGSAQFQFGLGEERTVGQNSRMMLADGMIYWVGRRDEFVRPTGPFDPELPVLAFRDQSSKLKALLFNHSTHTIGTRQPGKRSPSFYGLASQELETELGGTVCFLEGASGSTHNLTLSGDEATRRIKTAVLETLSKAQPRPVAKLAAIKRPFQFKARVFDEKAEEEAVTRYCRKHLGASAERVIAVFRDMRRDLAPQQGQERVTWLQVLQIGDVVIVGVPAEFFTKLGIDIKNRSPFRYTYVAELANDWIGYLPDLDGHKLGGYQVWTGHHSYAEPGTGERIVDEIVSMLNELAKSLTPGRAAGGLNR